jgi:hypothetical protein
MVLQQRFIPLGCKAIDRQLGEEERGRGHNWKKL